MMKFYLCLQIFSELRVPLEIFFGIISGKYLHVYLLENAKKVFNMLNIILVSDFCPLKDIKLLDNLSDFVLRDFSLFFFLLSNTV